MREGRSRDLYVAVAFRIFSFILRDRPYAKKILLVAAGRKFGVSRPYMGAFGISWGHMKVLEVAEKLHMGCVDRKNGP